MNMCYLDNIHIYVYVYIYIIYIHTYIITFTVHNTYKCVYANPPKPTFLLLYFYWYLP